MSKNKVGTCADVVYTQPFLTSVQHVTPPRSPVLTCRYGAIAVLYGIFLFLSLATRIMLLMQSSADIESTAAALLKMFAIGFFYDSVAFSYFMVPLTVYLALVPAASFTTPAQRYVFNALLFFLIALLVFTGCAEYYYWEEFTTRFDFVAVDYLVYRREVSANIMQSYPVGTVFPFIAISACLLFTLCRNALTQSTGRYHAWRPRLLTGACLLLLPCASYFFVDDSHSRISSNRLNNNLALNGIYSFFRALKANSLNYSECYASLPESDVAQQLRQAVIAHNARFINPNPVGYDIHREISANEGPEKQANVVLVVLESMSGEFLDALGGTGHLTPNLDSLARQGLLFTSIYATGTRTIRGLEAISLSVPPTPPVAILKRPHNENLFTIGTPLQQRGYETFFFYGGHSCFDNMKDFYTGNGFRVIDRADLARDEITFSSAWGVCDEDIYWRVVREADAAHERKKKFFMMVMTTSNHKPFTYPEGRIDIPSGTGRKGGVKYADYAVGRLIKEASARPWFDNTIFIFIADHCARSGGKDAIPIDHYRIPCIIYAPKIISARRVGALASQIDVAPTLFELLNWTYTSSFIGRSILTAGPENQRAFLNNHLTLGYMKEDMVVALEPGNLISSYRIDPVTHAETETAPVNRCLTEAITYYQGSSKLFDRLLMSQRELF